MPTYQYRAINSRGRSIRGELSADNDLDLEARLGNIGLDLVDWREARQKRGGGGRVQLKDKLILCMHMEQLGRAGVPLLEAIADVRDTTESARLRDTMASVYEQVKNGEQFSEALAKHPKVFDEVFVGLIAAGEKTGDLSEAFVHLSEHMKWNDDLKRKVRKAVGYPLFLLFVMSCVISVLMIFVVPKLIDFITTQGFGIPFHTRLLMAVSYGFANYWYLIFGIPTVLIIGLVVFYKVSEDFAYFFDSLMLRLPRVGPTIRKINMARFTHFFAVMFNSGIDILESLDGAKEVVNNRVLRESVEMARLSVSEGSSLTASLRISNQFPNLVVRMFKVGEDSGNMGEALENINFFYNREVNDSVDNMVGMIQPALTIVMGCLIFWVISAVFGPLYESFSKLNF